MRDIAIAQRLDGSDLGELSEASLGENRTKSSPVLATPSIFLAGVVIGMAICNVANGLEA